jgi:hypothetical protein
MISTSRRTTLLIATAAIAAFAALSVQAVLAQFGPPATVFGSIADSAGPVPEGLTVEAYIGDVECSDGHGRTQYTGVGADRVTVYAVDVISREQRPGCGSQGAEIRIKVGDRFAPQTLRWSGPGFVRHDITFGNAQPAAIPTFTPAVSNQATESPPPPGSSATPTSPGATPGEATSAATPESTAAAATATRRAGVTSSTPEAGVFPAATGGDGGFPAWGIVLLALGGLAAVGGGVGFLIARNQRAQAEDDLFQY